MTEKQFQLPSQFFTFWEMPNQHMAQERHKKVLMNLNPSLKYMAIDEKFFRTATPMLFGNEFVAKATDRVEQLKAITKVATKPVQKKTANYFLVSYHT